MNHLVTRPCRTLAMLAVALNALTGSQTARAWASLGHEVAGHIAARYLSAEAAARVEALLGREPLARASTWADRMRRDPDPFWQEQAGPWHYVTVPPGTTYPDVGAPHQGDAYTALVRFRAELCDPGRTRPQQQLALRFALHIIQDLQQPLHAGNGRDRGGNAIRVSVDGEETNLHWVWDGVIPASAGHDREAFIDSIDNAGLLRAPTAGDGDPLTWIAESTQLREQLYPAPAEIDADYRQRWLPVARARIALAGIRSAAWLNETFAGCGDAMLSAETAH